jgi:hypothetical protein
VDIPATLVEPQGRYTRFTPACAKRNDDEQPLQQQGRFEAAWIFLKQIF